ncbi:hypothetical protein NPIL_464861, partial [Nephila pilipes]
VTQFRRPQVDIQWESEMLRRRGLTTEEAMSLSESISLDCSDTLVESLSDEEMSIEDLPVTSSYGVQIPENGDCNLDEDLEEQNVPRVW